MRGRRLLLVMSAGLLAALPLRAQSPLAPAPRYGSLKAFPHGYVDRASLGYRLVFPIYSLPGVGHAGIQGDLIYDSSSGWAFVVESPVPDFQLLIDTEGEGSCGWVDVFGDGTDDGSGEIYETDYSAEAPNGQTQLLTSATWVDGPGRQPPDSYSDCPDGSPADNGYALMQTGNGAYTVQFDPTYQTLEIYNPAGDDVTGWVPVDPNGNQVSLSYIYSTNSSTYTDPLGNTLTAVRTAGAAQYTYTYVGRSGGNTTITETMSPVQVTQDVCGNPASQSLSLPTELSFPDAVNYQFGYDSSGHLSAVTLPTGGTIYFAPGCGTLSRWESVDGQSKAWTWSKSGATTTETSPAGDQTLFTFTSLANVLHPVLSAVARYHGAQAGGTEISATTLATTASAAGAITQTTATTERFGSPNLYLVRSAAFDGYGVANATSTTDWGTSSSGGPKLRQTSVDTFSGYYL